MLVAVVAVRACLNQDRYLVPSRALSSCVLEAQASPPGSVSGWSSSDLDLDLDSIDSPIASHADEPTGSPLLGRTLFVFWGGAQSIGSGLNEELTSTSGSDCGTGAAGPTVEKRTRDKGPSMLTTAAATS